jgi:hypothetical protein
MTVDNRTSLDTKCKYRLSSDTLFEVVTYPEVKCNFIFRAFLRERKKRDMNLGTSVGGDMRWNSMFGEDMDNEKFG